MVAKESAARTALVMDSFFLICFAWFYMVAAQKVILNPDNPAESRRQSSVEPILVNLVSYAGYIDTKEKQGIHLFFWFFKSESSTANTPLIVWLQGQQGKRKICATHSSTSLLFSWEFNLHFLIDILSERYD